MLMADTVDLNGPRGGYVWVVQEKKPTAVAVLLDTSGSMAVSGSMNTAKQKMAEFVQQLGDEDYLLPLAFSSDVRKLSPIGR
jgi:secreted protein with Ig-like and vWFA domain